MELLIATLLSLFVILMLSYGYRISSEVLQKVMVKKRENSFEKLCTLMQEQLLGYEELKLRKKRDRVALSYITPKAQTLKSPYAKVEIRVERGGVFYVEKPPYGGKEKYRREVLKGWMSIDKEGRFLILSFKGKRCYVETLPRTRSRIFWKGW